MKFNYVGVTRNQETVRGVVDATDETEARYRLRSMQIRPTQLSSKSAGFSLDLGFLKNLKVADLSVGSPVKIKQMMIFTRQFSSLIDAGIPVVQCLEILVQQEKNGVLKRTLSTVKTDIEGGSGLAQALAKHHRVFSEFFIRIVEAGEMSGTLDTALRRLGLQLEKLSRLRSKVIGALMYPCITLVVASVVLTFLLIKVVPEIAKLYSQSSAQLPELTVMVLSLSKWVQENFLSLFFGLVGSAVTFMLLYRIPSIRAACDRVFLKIPLFGSLLVRSAVARLSRTLSTLVSSGVPLISAFEICTKLMANVAIRESVETAAAYVAEGKTIANGLAAKGIFPPMMIHMVNIGEMTGKLDELLGKVADIYDEEVDETVGTMMGLLQPALIVVVGVLVAFLLVAMYLPIFQLADKMGNA